MTWFLIILVTLVMFGFLGISAYQKQKRLDRVDGYTLHQKLMASTLKNTNDGPIYF